MVRPTSPGGGAGDEALLVAWAIALAATLGALFIGEVMGQAPCALCWYQRIAMFPLVIVLGVAVVRDDTTAWHYALPLALAGLLVAIWHTLLFFGVISTPIQPCGPGPSCADINMSLWGAVPLPALSLIAFLSISLLLVVVARSRR